MTNKFKEMQIKAEILSELYEAVESKERYFGSEYKPVGERQASNWRTGELFWEDEEQTIPKMESVWDYVPKNEEDLTEEDKLRLKLCHDIKTALEKMI